MCSGKLCAGINDVYQKHTHTKEMMMMETLAAHWWYALRSCWWWKGSLMWEECKRERKGQSLQPPSLLSLALSRQSPTHYVCMYIYIKSKLWNEKSKRKQISALSEKTRGVIFLLLRQTTCIGHIKEEKGALKNYMGEASAAAGKRAHKKTETLALLYEMPLAHKKANFIHEFKPYWKIIGNFATRTKSCTVCKSFWLICFWCWIFSKAFCYNKLRLNGMCHDKWGMACMDLTYLTKSPLHPSI